MVSGIGGRVDWHVELDHPKTPRLFSVLMGSHNFKKIINFKKFYFISEYS